jgi:hypothetical protein
MGNAVSSIGHVIAKSFLVFVKFISQVSRVEQVCTCMVIEAIGSFFSFAI